jgi:hypothetical protein
VDRSPIIYDLMKGADIIQQKEIKTRLPGRKIQGPRHPLQINFAYPLKRVHVFLGLR